MSKQRLFLLGVVTLAALAALGFVACASDDGDDGGGKTATGDPVTEDDVVNVDDLLMEDSDPKGAVKVGEPAILLLKAQEAGQSATAHVKAVLARIKETVTEKTPAKSGTTKAGQPWGLWEKTKDGVTWKFYAIRINKSRLRYLLMGKKDADWKVVLTGVFVRKGVKKGGGRLHLNLTACTALTGAPGLDGQVHLFFANHGADARYRRVWYKNVKKSGEAWGRNGALDFVHKVGKGGRLRGVSVGDLIAADGIELAAMRVAWKVGKGGRADAVLSHIAPPPVVKIGVIHECWGKDGLRSAYKDDIKTNDKDDPDEGDTKDKAKCGDEDEQTIPETVAKEDGSDPDPELDTALTEAEAGTIPETEAADTTDPEAK